MKPEWITGNVKRAHSKWREAGASSSNFMLTLEEALALFDFAAEHANVCYRWVYENDSRFAPGSIPRHESKLDLGGPNYDLRVWPKGDAGNVFFIANNHGRYGHAKAESLLHATLMSIDAIVEHKPEAFA